MNKRYLAVIPARGGSKGIPRKNIRMLNGRPLLDYTIQPAKQAVTNGCINRLIVSTDDEEIASIAKKCGAEVPFMRPTEISGDNAKSVDALKHALQWFKSEGQEYDAVITLQVTSPFRTVDDIVKAIELFDNREADSLIAVYENRKANGYNYYRMGDDYVGLPLHKEHNRGIRRQDMLSMYVRNGAMYISSVELIEKSSIIIGSNPLLFEMPPERSIDIDSIEDFEYVNWLMQRKTNG